MKYRFNTIIEKDRNGYFAYCPELDGCMSQGDSYDEVILNIKEAISLYVSSLTKKEIKEILKKEIITANIEVAVA